MSISLRLRSVSVILIGSAMFGATFKLVTYRTTVIFETLKDDSLEINSLKKTDFFFGQKAHILV